MAPSLCIRRYPFIVALALAASFYQLSPAFISLPRELRPPVLILPGFGNDAFDYGDGELALTDTKSPQSDGGLVGRLQRRGFQSVEVLPVARPDWLRVAGALFDADFRAGTAPPRTAFGWYLDRLEETVEQVSQRHEGQKVLLLAHSAGGWLARAALGDGQEGLARRTRALVTLGAPHRAPPPDPPADDQTRGALTFVDENYPGAFLQAHGVEYITVAGAAVQGSGSFERGTPEREAWISYQRLVGRGEVPGDGIVPLENAHLPGATQVTIPDARHSIGTPSSWYGSESMIDRWLPQVTLCLAKQLALGSLIGAGAVFVSANSRRA